MAEEATWCKWVPIGSEWMRSFSACYSGFPQNCEFELPWLFPDKWLIFPHILCHNWAVCSFCFSVSSIWATSSEKAPSNIRKMCEFTFFNKRLVSPGYLLSIKTFYSSKQFCLQTMKTLIGLRSCLGWSEPLLATYDWSHVSHMAQTIHIDIFYDILKNNIHFVTLKRR